MRSSLTMRTSLIILLRRSAEEEEPEATVTIWSIGTDEHRSIANQVFT